MIGYWRSSMRCGATHDTAGTLRRMRGCRNILVHEYGRVSDPIVFDTIRKNLDDFDQFARAVLDALGRS